VSTSTIGIGSDFNEDLLIPMAEAGRGNAWHVERPADMERIFATEMEGLIAQVGHTVSLGLTPADNVRVVDVLNDFEVAHTGRYKLPNLLAGSPIDVVVRLKVPARAAGDKFRALDLRLAWNPQGAPSSDREVMNQSAALEFSAASGLEEIPGDERVIKAVQLLMAARARREAIRELDSGNIEACRAKIAGTAQLIAHACAPFSADAEVQQEMQMLEDLQANLAPQADIKMARKQMSYQSYNLSRRGKKS